MKRIVILLGMTLLAGACGEERRVIRDDSAASKFTSMMGGNPQAEGDSSSGGWSISRGGQPAPGTPGGQPVSAQALRIAELLKNARANPRGASTPADNPPGIRVITSFPDAPNGASQDNTGATQPAGAPGAPAVGGSPFGGVVVPRP